MSYILCFLYGLKAKNLVVMINLKKFTKYWATSPWIIEHQIQNKTRVGQEIPNQKGGTGGSNPRLDEESCRSSDTLSWSLVQQWDWVSRELPYPHSLQVSPWWNVRCRVRGSIWKYCIPCLCLCFDEFHK